MIATIQPSVLRGTVAAPPSKSHVQRLLLAAALSGTETTIHHAGNAADVLTMAACIKALGCTVLQKEDAILVSARRFYKKSALPHFPCDESGATLRFLLPVAAAMFPTACFTAENSLRNRPIKAFLQCLESHGVQFSARQLPFTTHGTLTAGVYALPGNISSQYVSGLLFALPLLAGESEIVLTSPLQSAGYVDMTLDVLRQFSIVIQPTASGWRIPGNQHYRSPGVLRAEGDWSSAAFPLVAGGLSGPVTVCGLPMDSLQPDREILKILCRFGAKIEFGTDWVCVQKAKLHGCTVDLSQIPDLAPAIAVLAAFASGDTILISAGRLRLKESDRIRSIISMLDSFGIVAEEQNDAMVIHGGQPVGGLVSSCGDHRIAMASAILASGAAGTTRLEEPFVISKSYPGFFEDFQQLGGKIVGI